MEESKVRNLMPVCPQYNHRVSNEIMYSVFFCHKIYEVKKILNKQYFYMIALSLTDSDVEVKL